ncbi:hypothetical protein JRO89_XS11G0066300 [Xanthoceras sorbifolium]|uniref:Reverse transcriptase domain-containing protein n=1 Tax=Xanthoceras sorbifolium TaxID=99658 RepID=A0ABQ8HEW1_9ROSI|nr:hypothetical protein JRO89_XS11G0066300 [Xanthoceras sorbifolium]
MTRLKLRLPVSLSLCLRFNSSYSINTQPLNPNIHQNEPLTKTQLKTLVLSHYSHGHFSNLIQNVVALPSVLLTASLSLSPSNHSPSLSKLFSFQELGRQLVENRLDIQSCFVNISTKGQSLVLPNLKLKVLIEAIRLVLEIVYDERFLTFSYGGRVNMGRHTAIRYLKNSVEHPSWWFVVSFDRQKFDKHNVDKLCLFIGEKIKDTMLIDLIKRLFDCEILKIELGGCYLGRGLPQECGLCSILINIYFNGFDRQLQEMRLNINEKNPKLDFNELGSTSNVYYKPLKIYAVRYLDEILVITSGSKMLTMDLKNRVMKFLEEKLELNVDRVKTAIHSAVSEKIDFLGMALQAVPPSVLYPPMSQKAIRARKKYLRQKEVRALELRNARERNRKRLGLKILNHVYKKLKQSNGFKFEFEIENEVRDIFKTWADEVVQEFFGSLEERWSWHRMLSRGDFLSLRHIRNQLPEELVDAYDKFQEQVNKHLTPVKARKALEEEERSMVQEEERKYGERTVEDLTRLCMKVSAPIELVRKAVKMAGFTNNMGRPRPISLLTAMEDTDIIKWYAGVGRRWLDFFCCCHNFKMVKTVVSYHLRFSCILTLAEKHESTKREAIKHYTKDLKVTDMEGNEEVYFPTEREVKMMGDKNLSDPKPVDGALSLALIRLASDEASHSCVTHFCDRTDTIIYRIRLLQNRMNVNPLDEEKWVRDMGAIHDGLNRKCIPLCSDHISDLLLGKITLQDIDCASFVDVD